MARWLEVQSAAAAAASVPGTHNFSLVALVSAAVFFLACATKLVALCAAHGNPQVLNRESEPEGELAVEAPQVSSNRKLSERFSPAAIQAKINSFRKSSFRSSGSFRGSSFRLDCASQVDVFESPQRFRQPPAHNVQDGDDQGSEESENTGPAVWQRAILRGERCAPLEFSGLILYDEKGNHIPLRNNNNHNNNNDNHQNSNNRNNYQSSSSSSSRTTIAPPRQSLPTNYGSRPYRSITS